MEHSELSEHPEKRDTLSLKTENCKLQTANYHLSTIYHYYLKALTIRKAPTANTIPIKLHPISIISTLRL